MTNVLDSQLAFKHLCLSATVIKHRREWERQAVSAQRARQLDQANDDDMKVFDVDTTKCTAHLRFTGDAVLADMVCQCPALRRCS